MSGRRFHKNIGLLILWAAVLLLTSSSSSSKSNGVDGFLMLVKTHVKVFNYLQNHQDVMIHCKSKDDDLQVQRLRYGEHLEWSFRVNFFGRTQYYCKFEWPGALKWFDIYVGWRDDKLCDTCLWGIWEDRPCMLNTTDYFGTQNMKKGILEVLLVHAKGIKRTNLIGKPSYYVILECGSQSQRSKISSGKHDKTWWNEKFTFQISSCDDTIKKLRYFKCTIMMDDTQLFTNGGFVGESRIYIGRIVSEGREKGYIEIKPASYNVVLEDDTYKGHIKIGFRLLFLNKAKHEIDEAGESNAREKKKGRSIIFGSIFKLWRISWYKILKDYKRN